MKPWIAVEISALNTAPCSTPSSASSSSLARAASTLRRAALCLLDAAHPIRAQWSSCSLAERRCRAPSAAAFSASRRRSGSPDQRFGVSARREIAAVNEHQVAVAKLHRPPPRRVHDVMLADIHLLARAVAEILHDDTEAFAVGARIHPHRYPDGELVVWRAVFRGPLVGVSH